MQLFRSYLKTTSKCFPTLLVAGIVALLLSRNFADPDFWGHVRYGQDLLREGLPSVSTYTYTAEGFRWINHENLSEIIFAMAVNLGQVRWLLVGKSLLGTVLLLWVVRRWSDETVPPTVKAFAVILTALNLMHFWSLRPQLFSYCLFVPLIALLDRAIGTRHDGGDRTLAWAIVPLMMVWTNTHGGFLAGFAVMVAYVSLYTVVQFPTVNAWLAMQGWSLPARHAQSAATTVASPRQYAESPSRHAAFFAITGRRIALLAITGLATLANPYGWHLHAWLLESLGSPRPEIVEWRPPLLTEIVWWQWWVMVALTACAFIFSRRSKHPVQTTILLLVLWQSIEHQRHIAFFAILFCFWAPPHLADVWNRLQRNAGERHPEARELPPWLVQGTLLLGLAVIGWQWLAQVQRIPVRRDHYPVSALQYIADQNLTGRLAVQFRWAQYSLAALSDHGIRVGFDGRFRTCYPQSVVDMYFDFAVGDGPLRHRVSNEPFRATRFLEHRSPNLLLVDRKQTHACQTVREASDEWVLLYCDSLAELWGRRAVYDDPTSESYIPASRRQVEPEPQTGAVSWPGFPKLGEIERRPVNS